MKSWKLLALCAFAAPLAFAAPNPARVPAEADLVIVGDRLDVKSESSAIFEEALRKAGVDVDAIKQSKRADKDKMSKQAQAILKAALGCSDDWESWTTKSIVCALVLPKDLRNLEKDASGLSLVCFIENPKVDVAAIDAAVKESLAAVKDPEEADVFAKEGAWSTLRAKIPDENLLKAFIGWRAIPEGLAVVFSSDIEGMTALVEGKAKALPSDSPLMAAFQPPAGAKDAWAKVMLRDVSDLTMRATTEEDRSQQAFLMSSGWMLKTQAFVLSAWQEQTKLRLVAELTAEDAETATQLRDGFLGMKTLFGMMLAQPQQPGQEAPSPHFLQWLNQTSCEAKGNVATIDLSVTQEQGVALMQAIEVKPAPKAGADKQP